MAKTLTTEEGFNMLACGLIDKLTYWDEAHYCQVRKGVLTFHPYSNPTVCTGTYFMTKKDFSDWAGAEWHVSDDPDKR
jgi:hypothetical protein